jgi:hypothetical protein
MCLLAASDDETEAETERAQNEWRASDEARIAAILFEWSG